MTEKEYFIEAMTGGAFLLSRGDILRVIDVEGEQTADFVAYNAHDSYECLDPGVTIDACRSYNMQPGDKLYSNRYNAMLTIEQDTAGKHDLFLPACRPEMYQILYNKPLTHPNCFDNLNKAIAAFGISPPHQHRPFNIFMNTSVAPDGSVKVKKPVSKAGDYIEFRAEMDLVIGISACPTKESACNGFHCTSIKAVVYPG